MSKLLLMQYYFFLSIPYSKHGMASLKFYVFLLNQKKEIECHYST